ncbi:hypothetical protein NY2A_b390L [Paramecium bursaria Chlorella virus NY2A]|uniref:Uncharacterized protein b390L n=1 Tax=Paramecium bursaria Chlorella virus NY2A TaxID=46021 RepID=A7IWR5_PBCVN|nr:hypothetical protein NY2A_b390L [Paramecium bursaria Chlorella virus NY2A]ABT14789.1 hypothetical protein NY2A_b390L [Paramecium bursaria Chlorella virus NY2A]
MLFPIKGIFFTSVCFAEFFLRFLTQTTITTTTFPKIISFWRQRFELFNEDHLYICEIPFVTPLEPFYVECIDSVFLYGVSKFHTFTTWFTMLTNSLLNFLCRHTYILISGCSESPYVKIRVIAHRSFEFK